MEFDFGRPFAAIFEDKAWWKTGLKAGLYFLIPIAGWLVVVGWSARYGRGYIREGSDTPLPQLDQFGADLVLGFKMSVIGLVYLLAPSLLTIAGIGVATALTAAGQQETGAMIATLLNIASIPISLVLGIWLPGAMILALAEDRLASGFAFRRIWALIMRNVGVYLMAVVVSLIAQVVGMFGAIGCGVGVLFTLPLAFTVHWHAVGQFWNIVNSSAPPASPAAAGS